MTEAGIEPFVSFISAEESVNWSDDLEALHEEASRTHFLDRWTRDAMVSRLGPLPATPLLADLGCSTGYLLEDLRTAYPSSELIGVDMVAAGLRKAHALVPDARLLQADVCDLPLEGQSLDGVVTANLLEHVPDDVRGLREINRVLRPGAHAVVVVPAGPTTYDYYDRFLGHERRYAKGELAAKARVAGLDVLEDTHIAALIYPAFWLVKQRNRRRFGSLEGEALQRQVAADIARTNDSRVGHVLWRLEERLAAAGMPRPRGVRSLTLLQKKD